MYYIICITNKSILTTGMTVLLGVRSGNICLEKFDHSDCQNVYVNKIGGSPTLLQQTLGIEVLKCQLCGTRLALVCQMFCPVDDGVDRLLYILVCISEACIKSELPQSRWYVYRAVSLQQQMHWQPNSTHKALVQSKNVASPNDWGGGNAENWDLSDAEHSLNSASDSKVSTGLASTNGNKQYTDVSEECNDSSSLTDNSMVLGRIDVASESNQESNDEAVAFDAYYIDVYEEEDGDGEASHINPLVHDYNQSPLQQVAGVTLREPGSKKKSGKCDSGNEKSSQTDGEKYEKTNVTYGDRCFYKFTKCLSKCPQQCIRYSHGGSPLMVSDTAPRVTPPSCERCGAPRSYELQLMPALIPACTVLGKPPLLSDAVEFGTVLVYTCSGNCVGEGEGGALVRECAVLQQEPLTSPRTRQPPFTH